MMPTVPVRNVSVVRRVRGERVIEVDADVDLMQSRRRLGACRHTVPSCQMYPARAPRAPADIDSWKPAADGLRHEVLRASATRLSLVLSSRATPSDPTGERVAEARSDRSVEVVRIAVRQEPDRWTPAARERVGHERTRMPSPGSIDGVAADPDDRDRAQIVQRLVAVQQRVRRLCAIESSNEPPAPALRTSLRLVEAG